MPRRSGQRAGALVGALMCLVACSGPTADTPASTPSDTANATASGETEAPGTRDEIPDPDEIDPARLEPLEQFDPCPSRSDAAPGTPAPTDLPLPASAEVGTDTSDDSVRSLQGFVPLTPVELMVDLLRRDDWEVLEAEDEVFEAEVLMTDGDVRVFIKAQAACARGSQFVLFVGEDAEDVPTPAGTDPAEP